jgi:hypothetical protein
MFMMYALNMRAKDIALARRHEDHPGSPDPTQLANIASGEDHRPDTPSRTLSGDDSPHELISRIADLGAAIQKHVEDN